VSEPAAQQLQGDAAAAVRLLRLVDLPHASLADRPDDEIRPEALAASKQERQIRRESRPSRGERPRDTVGGPERRKVRIVRRWSGRSVGVHPPSVFWEPRFYMKRRPGTGLAFVAPARPATVRRSRAAVLALGL